MLPDDATAEAWFADARWPNGLLCLYCQSERVQSGTSHPTMPYRFRDCRKFFSVRTGTVMAESKLGYLGEFAGRHNARPVDTLDQMELMARGMMGKRLTFQELVADA